MKNYFLIPVLLGAALACSTPTVTPEERDNLCGPAPSQDQALAAVESWRQGCGLKDPASAQIQGVQVQGQGYFKNGLLYGGKVTNGWVISFRENAKNSYGGYVGFRPCWLIWNRGRVTWMDSVVNDNYPWAKPHPFE